ncbi:amino acid--tRNA ligase-related protein [Leptospira levettii]|uniref:Elongation factor P--(R)-beta-lysine ligase n=1 Tax=Leptospira levettii TaxID=2023178 RepID=A0ABY2MT92_9LEPT|nr:amino acid--tRNA ligase-related protein [Leptospira levettii]PKA23052.1 elongation factor P--(R)-beta-lysine ligase [Leptospira sp. mixed culture ATI2-C-A1]TGL74714.1 elongation factor P--(R)-beta-lysine ligase [Leptospira levettii]TGM26230.1 elongation factor P--(R)-beta-lysine ligase [Leptospira levettii]TGM88215.1 elongation factor P--(R)-beta-lysine ligase [Leptospira levettii]
MHVLPKETLIFRSRVLQTVREILSRNEFLEVDTPTLKPIVGMEPYLDPFEVRSPSGKEKGYLITSPEYSLKQMMATGLPRIFELAHTYRSGEVGSSYHTKEFLMLELYVEGMDDEVLLHFIETFLRELIFTVGIPKLHNQLSKPGFIRRFSVQSVFLIHLGHGFEKENLIPTIIKQKLTSASFEELQSWQYEDLFFLVFLNCIEPKLGEGIVFLYDYPPECAALARIEKGVAKRFEIYWDGLELANAFYELNDPNEQRKRFADEQTLRAKLGKEVFPMDEDFLEALGNGFPNCSGISIGMDRLILKLLGKNGLREVSPYWMEL